MTSPMQRYILIDENSGYVWGDCYAATPALACQEIDENLGVSDRQYEDIGHEPFNGRSGYHVHIAHELFVPIDDGREPLLINAVMALPLAARVATHERLGWQEG